MAGEKLSLLSLEDELTSVIENALEEERENVRNNFKLLEDEREAVKIPYPNTHLYETVSGSDYEDHDRLMF